MKKLVLAVVPQERRRDGSAFEVDAGPFDAYIAGPVIRTLVAKNDRTRALLELHGSWLHLREISVPLKHELTGDLEPRTAAPLEMEGVIIEKIHLDESLEDGNKGTRGQERGRRLVASDLEGEESCQPRIACGFSGHSRSRFKDQT